MKKEGMILRLLLGTLFFIILSQSNIFSQDKSSILFNWKDWMECSEQEKDSLRLRWTGEEIIKVVSALKTSTPLPDFVKKIGDRKNYPSYDLRGIPLIKQDLKTVTLSYAYLDGAILDSTSLDYANLQGANMQGASLRYTNLKWAHLEKGNLQGAFLWYANLQGANLSETDLQGAKLYHTNLQSARLLNTTLKETSLFRARFDTTDIWQTNLEEAKNIRDIVWGDSLHDRYFIFVEKIGDTAATKKDREGAFRNAEITYRDLKSLYKKEGMDEIANEFQFKEYEMLNKQLKWYLRMRCHT